MKKVLVLGKGFISDHLSYEKMTDRIYADEEAIFGILNKHKPDVLVNCIGRTGSPNIDWCEKNQTKTYMANVVIPSIIAAECERLGIHMIHFGSGCIFYGQSSHINTTYEEAVDIGGGKFTKANHKDYGWKESDIANPKSYYSKTKYACDMIIGDMKNVTVLRLRMPISTMNHPRNLLNKLIQYKQVLEEPNSVTFMDDLVKAIDFVISKEKMGIYHITSPNPITHSVLLDEYKKYVPEHTYEKITDKELIKLVVAPRSNCILSNRKVFLAGFDFAPIDTHVRECVEKFVQNIKK